MAGQEGLNVARGTFEMIIGNNAELDGLFYSIVRETAREHFEAMLPRLAYTDDPSHPMASSLFFCTTMLALFMAVRTKGVDVHTFGNMILQQLKKASQANESDEERSQDVMTNAARKSQEEAKPGEFVFEYHPGDAVGGEYAMNIKSCGICYLYSQYDAKDLVPYICATDDVISDQGTQGLRRTGTIGLGAHQCDFVYKRGGEPLRLAEQYPEKIRIVDA